MFRYIVSPAFSRAKNKLVANQVTMLPSRQVMAAEILLVLFSRSLDWLTDPQGVIVGALLDGEGYVSYTKSYTKAVRRPIQRPIQRPILRVILRVASLDLIRLPVLLVTPISLS